MLSTYAADDTLRVHLTQPSFTTTLGRFLGVNSARVGAQASAVVASPSAYSRGIMPFGLMSSDSATGAAAWGYEFNTEYVLKQGAGTSEFGNFQLVDIPGTSDLKKVISDGGASAYIGETIQSHPGDVAALMRTLDNYVSADSHTMSNVVEVLPDGTVSISDYTCPHLIVVPIIWIPGPPAYYSWSDMRGKEDVQILGFAWMWVQSATQGTGPTGQSTITGTFLRPLTPEEASDWGSLDPYGAIGFRLID